MSALNVRAAAAQTRMELILTLRRGENILVTLVIPIVLLLFFASTNLVPTNGTGSPLDFLVPGILALAIISSGMVNLGISTAYERHYGVLKRLGGSPLPRAGLLAAKAASILTLEIAQVVLVVGVAIVGLGWQPRVLVLPSILAIVLGTLAFSGLGLAMAGAFRAEATLALANGLYLALLLLGNIVLPTDHLPAILRPLSDVLPATVLADLFRFALGRAPTFSVTGVVILLAWAVGFTFAAVRWFRWE